MEWDCDPNKLYTIIFSSKSSHPAISFAIYEILIRFNVADLDTANDTHIWGFQIHWWLVVNIPHCDETNGDEIFMYIVPKMWPEYGNATTQQPVLLSKKKPNKISK